MERQRHMTDQMFLVILFAVFAVCAFSLSMIGANIYSHTASVDEINIKWGKDETADSGSVHYGRNSVRVSDGKLC